MRKPQNPPARRAWCLTPRGEPLTQGMVREVAAGPGLILLCGGSRASTSACSRRGPISARSRSAITSSPAARSGRSRSSMPACASFPGSWGKRLRGRRRASRPASSNTRTTPGRKPSRGPRDTGDPHLRASRENRRLAPFRGRKGDASAPGRSMGEVLGIAPRKVIEAAALLDPVKATSHEHHRPDRPGRDRPPRQRQGNPRVRAR